MVCAGFLNLTLVLMEGTVMSRVGVKLIRLKLRVQDAERKVMVAMNTSEYKHRKKILIQRQRLLLRAGGEL